VVSSSRQVFIDAPLDEVWELTADPERQTEWWPDTKEFECEAGNDPKNLGMRVMDATIGKRLFARWVDHAVDRIQQVAEKTPVK
jgi:uncharacterized protein YndB with AHSA1/START domain